ncbi:MAG: Na-Ca exchanger-like protein [Caudovirales sp. ctOwN3]|nr:MAG: Na-Ca exchanger-like protein [Caudovirales sp. ctOwN3]
MWYAQSENKYINEGSQFELDGITYPAQWLNQATLEQKEAIGLQEVIATNSPANDQYYWVSTTLDGASLTYVNTPKDLDMVKKNASSTVDSTAYSILLPSDYMAGKAFETGTAVPADWATWRESIRQTARDTLAAITNAADVDEVEAIMTSIVWDKDPNYVEPVVEPELVIG